MYGHIIFNKKTQFTSPRQKLKKKVGARIENGQKKNVQN